MTIDDLTTHPGQVAIHSNRQVTGGGPDVADLLPRRSFLHRLGLGTATVFVVANGAIAYRGWDQGIFAAGEGPAFQALNDWQSFSGPQAAVAAAVLAASAHNTQPWAFTVNGDRIALYGDLSRTIGANDPLLREFRVSLGCALENLVLAAQATGYTTNVQLNPQPGTDLVATVTLETGSPVASQLYEVIDERRSNRSDFKSEPLPSSFMTSMSALATPDTRLLWLEGAADRSAFADLLMAATQAHNEDEAQSQDSFAWWRNDWDQVQEHKDGLNIDGAGLPPLTRSLAKLLPGVSRSKSDEVFLERTEKQAETAAAFGVITVDDPYSVEQQLQGGRLLQRLHLHATVAGVGFQHMNQITERIDRDRELENAPVFEQPLADLVGPGTLAAFRVGRPTVESMASPRRPIDEVTR